MKTFYKLHLLIAALSLMFMVNSVASASTGGWKLFSSGAEGFYGINNPVFAHGDYLYCGHFACYYRVKLKANGQFGEATSVSSGLGMGLAQSSIAVNGDRVYITGGKAENDIPNFNSFVVYYATFDSKGYLSRPVQTYDLRTHRAFHASLVVNNRLYVLGGYSHNEYIPQYALKSVEYADIDTTTGAIKEPFRYTSSFSAISGKVYLAFNQGNRIYCLGETSDAPQATPSESLMEYADIQEDGSLGEWHPFTGLPGIRPDIACLTQQTSLFILAPSQDKKGHPSMLMDLPSDKDQLKVRIRTRQPSLINRRGSSAISWGKYVYLLGGDKASYEVYEYDNAGAEVYDEPASISSHASRGIDIPMELKSK